MKIPPIQPLLLQTSKEHIDQQEWKTSLELTFNLVNLIGAVTLPVLNTKNVCEFFYWGFAVLVPVLSSSGVLTVLTLIAVNRFIAAVFHLKGSIIYYHKGRLLEFGEGTRNFGRQKGGTQNNFPLKRGNRRYS